MSGKAYCECEDRMVEVTMCGGCPEMKRREEARRATAMSTEITDEMCRRAVRAMVPDRIQGFSTPQNRGRTEWGPPHFVRDVWLPAPASEQVLWTGDSHAEMLERCKIEEMRIALRAALSVHMTQDRR